MNINEIRRKTNQEIMPQILKTEETADMRYNLYPFHSLTPGKILSGYDTLAGWIAKHPVVKIDGYVGVDWQQMKVSLQEVFIRNGIRVNWIEMPAFFKPEQEINELVAPYLGAADSVWGTNTGLSLDDFFLVDKFSEITINSDFQINIIIGVGANLVPIEAPLVYLDLPKSELLYRMRANSITNLATSQTSDNMTMYKRLYFVDWVVLNKHKQELINKINIFVDAQWEDNVSWALAEDLFAGMKKMSRTVFRPRPWFDPGIWGGQWMKERFAPLGAGEENLAWSFEIIAPENGLVFESEGVLLELSFDTLMYRENESVLGIHAKQFGSYFPIRFDFLDTFDGGNLSIQCHPTVPYIQQNFGETYTQDETYYILDCKQGAEVYLGFQDDINPDQFRSALEDSVKNDSPLQVDKYVQRFPSVKHELFLIPNGTVHSSGKNNLVLEISATPYIFTFKMYDWLQKDAQGKPRPINIEHAFNNLDFQRKGARVAREFISAPQIVGQGQGWNVVHLPTHKIHYYDVHRLEFTSEIEVQTEGVCHILMLVEGTSIEVITADGSTAQFNYAETFIIPAAAEGYRLINQTNQPAKVIKAFLKADAQDSSFSSTYMNNQGGDGKD